MSLLTQRIHDTEQASRRSRVQNQAIVDVVEGSLKGGEAEEGWAYTDIPEDGGEVVLTAPSGQRWRIDVWGIAYDESGGA